MSALKLFNKVLCGLSCPPCMPQFALSLPAVERWRKVSMQQNGRATMSGLAHHNSSSSSSKNSSNSKVQWPVQWYAGI